MTLVGRSEGPRRSQGVEARGPQRLVGVDVADSGDERLVEQERLEPTGSPPKSPSELAHREGLVKRLRTERREDRSPADLGHELARHRVAPVQSDLPELADVAEADLPPVGQLQDEPYVRILGRRGGYDEQLPGHLEVDRQGGPAGQLDHDELRPSPDRIDTPTRERIGECRRRMRSQCPGP